MTPDDVEAAINEQLSRIRPSKLYRIHKKTYPKKRSPAMSPPKLTPTAKINHTKWVKGTPGGTPVPIENAKNNSRPDQAKWANWQIIDIPYHDVRLHQPPQNVRLSDYLLAKVVEQLARKYRGFWPADFGSDGNIRRDRANYGQAAKVMKDGEWHYLVFKGYYVLQGDEGWEAKKPTIVPNKAMKEQLTVGPKAVKQTGPPEKEWDEFKEDKAGLPPDAKILPNDKPRPHNAREATTAKIAQLHLEDPCLLYNQGYLLNMSLTVDGEVRTLYADYFQFIVGIWESKTYATTDIRANPWSAGSYQDLFRLVKITWQREKGPQDVNDMPRLEDWIKATSAVSAFNELLEESGSDETLQPGKTGDKPTTAVSASEDSGSDAPVHSSTAGSISADAIKSLYKRQKQHAQTLRMVRHSIDEIEKEGDHISKGLHALYKGTK
ncbi:MAG: hypothetical protein M4579_007114 [Chaenotheca gracillima]|nr:MAG: hypothetical protein M4579_007114 [Chaenotheca gracillima]